MLALSTYTVFFSLEPEWAAAATEVKEQTKGKVKLAAVDATVNQMLASRYGVSVFCSSFNLLSISNSDFHLMLTELFLNLVPLKCFVLKIMLSDAYQFSTNNSFLNVSNNINKFDERKGINLDVADEKGCLFP